MNLLQAFAENLLLFDGAMGTMLQSRGLEPGGLPELLNITAPEIVTGIHREYVEAGADIITANTFQAHELKLGEEHSVEDVVRAGIDCARMSGARFVALDVGPLGQLMEPMGPITFERAYSVYARMMRAGEKAGVDLILIETISDLYEAKAAVLAAKENTKLPVFCTMTFGEDGRTFVGCDALSAVITLQGLGVDALGANCSLGVDMLAPIIENMLEYSRVPVILQANAGMPEIRDGKTEYDTVPEDYAAKVAALMRKGLRAAGGCCGTTPSHIAMIRREMEGLKPVYRTPKRVTACSSGVGTLVMDEKVSVIGERLNPTGKKALKDALRRMDMAHVIKEAIAQERAGADALDINVGLPELDEAEVIQRVIREVQAVVRLPLQIDSADAAAIEAGVRIYNGKPIINSANGKEESLNSILPIAKKYGALVVCLTLDENGIPPTAEGRLDIARRIKNRAAEYGIPEEDLIIDCLTLTLSAQQEQAGRTLEAIRRVKSELGLKTVLGVSNVSFGLPGRELINSSFLAMALGTGLDAAIINPLSEPIMDAIGVFRLVNGEDSGAEAYIAKHSAQTPTASPAAGESGLSIQEIIEQGRKDEAAGAVEALLENTRPLEIIDREFIPALRAVGTRFERGEIFLPQLMRSAQAVQNGFAIIKAKMEAGGGEARTRGKIIIATVQGDIHDIGKNIVGMMLESYGFEVIDLGKDVSPERIVKEAAEQEVRLVGLSALMTTTLKGMKDTIALAKERGLESAFFVGGAVLSEDYAEFVGADWYAKDAMAAVAVAERFFEE